MGKRDFLEGEEEAGWLMGKFCEIWGKEESGLGFWVVEVNIRDCVGKGCSIFFFFFGLLWKVGCSHLLQLSTSLIGVDEAVYILYTLKRLHCTVECGVE